MGDEVTATHQVTFRREERSWSIDAQGETTLFEAARAAQAPVETLCHGIGACVQCKVRVISGDLTPPTPLERDRLGNVFHLTGERLSCQARVLGPVDLEIPVKRRRRRNRKS